MRNHRISVRRSPRYIAGVALAMSAAMLPIAAQAQWPITLGGGTNARAGDVLALPGGSVAVLFDKITAGEHKLKSATFNGSGAVLLAESDRYMNNGYWPIKTQLLPSHSSQIAFSLTTQFAKTSLDASEITIVYEDVKPDGTMGFGSWSNNRQFEASTNTKFHTFSAYYNPADNTLGCMIDGYVSYPDLNIGGTIAKEFSIVPIASQAGLISFTRYMNQTETPSEIWTYNSLPGNSVDNLHKAQAQLSESQTKSQLTVLGSSQYMLTWLGDLNGQKHFYEKILDSDGNELTGMRTLFPDVVDYVVTTDTLGLPAFAAIQHDTSVAPPTDKLIAGLINPTTGDTLFLPIATAPGVKVKAVRQEADGNFSLAYSIPESGTNVLKIRRISGTTAATLWESTVANLGTASNAIVERYPNTFIDGTPDGTLYVLSRYDVPNTYDSQFNLMRVPSTGL